MVLVNYNNLVLNPTVYRIFWLNITSNIFSLKLLNVLQKQQRTKSRDTLDSYLTQQMQDHTIPMTKEAPITN